MDNNNFDKIKEIYKENIKDDDHAVSIEDVISISKDMNDNGDTYRHSDYQCMIAACATSMMNHFKIVVVPTGSGKTWMQGLIAKYHCLRK